MWSAAETSEVLLRDLLAAQVVGVKLSPKAQEAMREEQRRLFYVALTRPTETLMLSSVTYIPMDQALGMGLTGRTGHVILPSWVTRAGKAEARGGAHATQPADLQDVGGRSRLLNENGRPKFVYRFRTSDLQS